MAELKDRTPVEDWSTDFDHFDAAFIADPDSVWAALRTNTPVAHSNRYGGLNVLTRWEDVAAAARSAGFSGPEVTEMPANNLSVVFRRT